MAGEIGPNKKPIVALRSELQPSDVRQKTMLQTARQDTSVARKILAKAEHCQDKDAFCSDFKIVADSLKLKDTSLFNIPKK